MDAPLPRSGPHLLLTLREAAASVELLRLVARLPELARHPRGNGEPVLVLPGFAAGDGSTWLLRSHLRALGYRVSGWRLGVNLGDVPSLLPRVARAVAERAHRIGAPLRMVGWSLGGYLAREVAREAPECIDRVITLGTPVLGGPRYTATAAVYRALGVDFDAIETAMTERERAPIGVPIVAIYSKQDGIVDWRACIDRQSPRVEHVRVRASHLGLGFSPEVLRLVAE